MPLVTVGRRFTTVQTLMKNHFILVRSVHKGSTGQSVHAAKLEENCLATVMDTLIPSHIIRAAYGTHAAVIEVEIASVYARPSQRMQETVLKMDNLSDGDLEKCAVRE